MMLLINNYQIIGLMILITIGFLIIWSKKLESEENISGDNQQQNKIKHKYTYFLSRMDITSAEIGVMIGIGIAIFIGFIFAIEWLIKNLTN
ncbi:MAG: hypothetical protein Q7U69_05055 [Sulfuricurvum sp.]|uniref:hypothetical protein n=1 Tax=Sulfuricurvum sp. TaxID=2025608 RepID=UPI002720481B|nr:hypothetical protein [Sulfuricurvum sp.]MDO9055895.1 hypothetical protein [Sulfuricurvum sp.]